MSQRSLRVLRLLTPLSAFASLVAHGLALLTNEWLFSTELITNNAYVKFNMSPELEHHPKNTTSGLWVICHNEPGNDSFACKNIEYFTDEEYAPDPNDSTGAIPYAAKRAAIFMLLSSVILITGALLSLAGHTCSRRRIYTFTSGIAFILSGLMILAGMVIFISTFKSEVGNKLRPKSTFVPPLFTYEYGHSFHFAVLALMLCEITGTFSIFLYILMHQIEWKEELSRQQFCHDFGGGHLPSVTLHPPDLPPPPVIYCRKHGRGRRYSRSPNINSRETSPVPGMEYMEKSPRSSLTVPDEKYGQTIGNDTRTGLTLSDSMRDLTYYNFPTSSSQPFSRDTTFNTMSTSADLNRGDMSREHSRDLTREISRDFLYRSEYPSNIPPPPPPPPQATYEREYEDLTPPRREFSYETLRRTTPV